jgi:hypothetical protein
MRAFLSLAGPSAALLALLALAGLLRFTTTN